MSNDSCYSQRSCVFTGKKPANLLFMEAPRPQLSELNFLFHVFNVLANFNKILWGLQKFLVLTNFREMIDKKYISKSLKEKFIA